MKNTGNICHIKIGGTELCQFPLSLPLTVHDEAKKMGVLPCCEHLSYRDAVMLAALLDAAGRGNGNIVVVPGRCQADRYDPYEDSQ